MIKLFQAILMLFSNNINTLCKKYVIYHECGVTVYIRKLYEKSWFPQSPKLTTDTTNVHRVVQTREQLKREKKKFLFPKPGKELTGSDNLKCSTEDPGLDPQTISTVSDSEQSTQCWYPTQRKTCLSSSLA